MKIVKNGSQPLTEEEFSEIRHLAETKNFYSCAIESSVNDIKDMARLSYLKKIMSFIDISSLKPLKIVINSGNGAAGPVIDALKKKLDDRGIKTDFIYLNHDPDPSFPNGIPNPLLEENRVSTSRAVIFEKADFGVAFDGDFDRCFLFDNYGKFVPGEYVVGLLSEVFLKKEKGATIIHDSRVVWNTTDIINSFGGNAFVSKTGHSFVKAAMRAAGAIYGGEMSAHHYFRDFAFCDSGMIPWLLTWELLSQKNISLDDLISDRRERFPSSGEINFTISNAEKCFKKVKNFYCDTAISIDEFDGLSVALKNWRFNLRKSNTENFVRLNIETKSDKLLLKEKKKELRKLIANA